MTTPRSFLLPFAGRCLAAFALLGSVAVAQKVETRSGFDVIAKPVATGEERQAQPNLWIFELEFKSLRMIEVEITDARTGTKRPELLYYLVYKAINREIDRKVDDEDRRPVNDPGENPKHFTVWQSFAAFLPTPTTSVCFLPVFRTASNW